MEASRSKEGISVSQEKQALDLLTKTCMMGCRLNDTLIEFNDKLYNFVDKLLVNKEKYQHLVKKLIYLSHTRPYISYVVNTVSQFMQASYQEHMKVENKIMRYLKTTSSKGLVF